jgi:hypothetical protein
MPNELTHLSPHIDEMRTKLAQNSESERSLVQTLSDELKRFDQQILQGIRTLAAEHEARRVGILEELQALAGSIGTFHHPREQPTAIQQPTPPKLSYHDELEASLTALLSEGSRHRRAAR